MIRCSKLIDGTGVEPIEDALIIVEDSKIKEVGKQGEISPPKNASFIDATGKIVMPGMIDAHIHFTGTAYLNLFSELAFIPEGLRIIRSVVEAQNMLEAGFTSVLDAGGSIGFCLKRAIEENTISGPRILCSGRMIAMTGGHGDAQTLPKEWVMKLGLCRLADGPDECRKAAREQIRDGADMLKISTTGGLWDWADLRTKTQFTVDEIRAVVEEANRVGIKVHSHNNILSGWPTFGSNEGIQNAIIGGVKIIDHGCFIDDETLQMMLKNDVVYVPTTAIHHVMASRGSKYGLPDFFINNLREAENAINDTVKRAYKLGVTIASGSDFMGSHPLSPLGEECAIELSLLVKAGLTEMDAIVAATKNNAYTLGILDKVGTIEEGKIADIIIVDGDPLKKINILQNKKNIHTVIKNGEIIKRSK